MSRGRWEHADRRAFSPVLDVVAGLVPGSSAARVARAAVREAVARGARVRFVQILESGGTEADRDADGASTFAAALKALRESPRVPVSFEIAVGEAGPLLVERSRSAGVLVVGSDDPDDMPALAVYCLEHAACDVLTARPVPAGAAP